MATPDAGRKTNHSLEEIFFKEIPSKYPDFSPTALIIIVGPGGLGSDSGVERAFLKGKAGG